MAEKENQRVMLTKQMIKQSLIVMLESTPLRKISVHALCQAAQINRSTFYRHYNTAYDVLSEIETEVFSQIEHLLNTEQWTDWRLIESICTFLEQNINTARLLLDDHTNSDLSSRLFQLPQVRNLMFQRISKSYQAPDDQYVFTFLASGCFSVMKSWVYDKNRISGQAIAHVLYEIMERMLS